MLSPYLHMAGVALYGCLKEKDGVGDVPLPEFLHALPEGVGMILERIILLKLVVL